MDSITTTPFGDFKMRVDDSGFQETFKEYMTWSKDEPANIVNSKLYFIALAARKFTRKVDQNTIINYMAAKFTPRSGKPTKLTLGEFLAVRSLARRGGKQLKDTSLTKKGLKRKNGSTVSEKLVRLAQRFTNSRVSHIGFSVAGWNPALKGLNFWNRKDADNVVAMRRFGSERLYADKENNLQSILANSGGKFKPKGGMQPARLGWQIVKGVIFNSVGTGKQASPTIHPIIQHGLDIGVQRETASMKIYIEKRHDQEVEKMRRKGNSGLL